MQYDCVSIHTTSLKLVFCKINMEAIILQKKTYNRICITISDANKKDLDQFVLVAKRRMKSINNSTVVDIALAKFFEDATISSVADHVQKLNKEGAEIE